MIACVEDIRIQKRAHFSESLNYDIPISREESLPGNGYIRSVHVEHAVIACNHICLKKKSVFETDTAGRHFRNHEIAGLQILTFKSIFLLREMNSFFMQILPKKKRRRN